MTRRFASGLSFDVDYTFSKSLDDASDTGTTNAEFNLPQDPSRPGLEVAPSSFDHRHRFTANVIYDLPFARASTGWLQHAFSDWRGSAILVIQSGAPFTVNLSSAHDVANIGLIGGNNIERPNLTADPNGGPKTPEEWFNVGAFALPAQYTFGNAGRNIVVGPSLADILKIVGARGQMVELHSFDDYTYAIPATDADRYGVILAYSMNGKRLQMSDFGPLFLIYPRDQYPDELSTAGATAKFVWQIKSLVIK